MAAYCESPWGFCLQHVCTDILHVIIFVNSGPFNLGISRSILTWKFPDLWYMVNKDLMLAVLTE